ncbi:hypothetical protein LW135_02425 [Helicobacter sp. faydin-H20]|uniref:hypothetical protein n=1 Tax=Helicobacter anatolicus TaxID=2905874 RepID=UPI001E41E9DC|nr:hypothetical protein [Helicobacter anatolicus]MCE3036688.1 hypothetical protein [Helicobacter anatolicus]
MIVFVFLGCSTVFVSDDDIDILSEKKVQASRKGEIIKDKKNYMNMIVTHLNEVSQSAYNNREYFFVEIFQEEGDGDFSLVEYTLNGITPLWIREVKSDEFDEIIKPSNKWSKCYLLAFRKIANLESRDMVLNARVVSYGTMTFDFSFKTLPQQF